MVLILCEGYFENDLPLAIGIITSSFLCVLQPADRDSAFRALTEDFRGLRQVHRFLARQSSIVMPLCLSANVNAATRLGRSPPAFFFDLPHQCAATGAIRFLPDRLHVLGLRYSEAYGDEVLTCAPGVEERSAAPSRVPARSPVTPVRDTA
jgi:hypothetical protein